MSSHQTHHEEILSQEKIREENLAARRAAAEAVSISRATLETTVAQGEQLQHCESLQERNRYIVTKSARIIRGMTWSGWMMNMFSKEAEPPVDDGKLLRKKDHNKVVFGGGQQSTSCSRDDDNDIMANMPQEIQDQAWTVQNYEFNVKLLEQCQNDKDFETCREICNSLCLSAQKALEDVKGTTAYQNVLTKRSILHLQKKFMNVKQLQRDIIQQKNEKLSKGTRQPLPESKTSSKVINSNPKRNQLWANTHDKDLQQRILHQEEHIDALQENLDELLQNGISMGVSLTQQNQLLDKLDVGADELREETKMVTRRADRLSHRSLWRKPPKDFLFRVAFQHVNSQQYLSVEPHNNKKLALHNNLHPDMSVFDVYERRGSKLIGIQNRCTGTWLGLSILGYVVCNSNKFGSNEEWELDDEPTNKTRILCASANWGNGGWLELDARMETFSIGHYGLDSKKNAALWSMVVLSNNTNTNIDSNGSD